MWSSVHATRLAIFLTCTVVIHTRDFSSSGYKETSAGALPLCCIALIIDNKFRFKSHCNCILRLGDL